MGWAFKECNTKKSSQDFEKLCTKQTYLSTMCIHKLSEEHSSLFNSILTDWSYKLIISFTNFIHIFWIKDYFCSIGTKTAFDKNGKNVSCQLSTDKTP